MPMDHSPVKTRNTAKSSSNQGKPAAAGRTLSDTALSVDIGPDMKAAIQASIELTLMNDLFINRLVDLVAAKVSDLVNDNLNSTLQLALDKIGDLAAEVDSLKKKVLDCECDSRRRDDELEQYTRRNSLRVFGVPENQGEDTDVLVRDIFSSKLDVNIDARRHRPFTQSGPSPCPG